MQTIYAKGRRFREFLSGDYKGAPVDYVLALVMVFTAMGIVVIQAGPM